LSHGDGQFGCDERHAGADWTRRDATTRVPCQVGAAGEACSGPSDRL